MRNFIRPVALALTLALFLTVCVPASAQVQPTIRVYLKKLGVQDSIFIDFEGSYMVEGGGVALEDGASAVVVLRGDTLVLHAGGASVVLGESAKLIRCEPDGGFYVGNSGLFEGDLALHVVDGVILPVLHIDIESYLLGVVPYEMGDTFPLEALKAQAIAARTYALRRSGSPGLYDVEDGTNDQVFQGRDSASPLSEQAVRETTSVCGIYNGALANCYYSASNGGQTELGEHVWQNEDEEFGHLDMRDDPYDLQNEDSVVKRYTIAKAPGEEGVGDALHTVLVRALQASLREQGHKAEDDLVRIDEVLQVTPITPKFEGDSRLMTELRVVVKVSVRDRLSEGVPAVTAAPDAGEQAGTVLTEAVPPTYTAYRPLDQEYEVVLPYFGEGGCEQAMDLSINVMPNELVTVVDADESFIVEARRYGHGVGLSQRGAQQMAQQGMTVNQILSFYYPGMTLATVALERSPMPTPDALLMSTPAPSPSPTPRPTLMPVTTDSLPEGAYVAFVSNIEDDSSLNLRNGPNMSADVLRRLFKYQELIVLESTEDGWSHVKTDVLEGYVRTEFLQTVEQAPAPQVTPDAAKPTPEATREP